MFLWVKGGKTLSLISTTKASKLLCPGCIEYWCYAIDIHEKEQIVEDISIVCEFRDGFPDKLQGLPPQREIEFEIELVSGTQLISKPPYRMIPTKLRELKLQLADLL